MTSWPHLPYPEESCHQPLQLQGPKPPLVLQTRRFPTLTAPPPAAPGPSSQAFSNLGDVHESRGLFVKLYPPPVGGR